MSISDFTTTILVDQTPKAAFDAINNVRGWWSEAIEGSTDQLHEEFTYHHKDAHICKLKLIELIPDQKVVWLVLDNYFNFTKDKTEWNGTKICFDIFQADNKTKIRFTHLGLVPEYECFDICSNAWGQYIQQSLWGLITTGKGRPNPIEEIVNEAAAKAAEIKKQDYHVSFTVDAAAREVFSSINSVSKWWTEDLEGSSQYLNDEFRVRFGDVHVSTQKLVELIPDKKVVWLVTDSRLNFITKQDEWTGTKISFELSEHDHKTQVNFTHIGLVPEVECFNGCSKGWDQYIKGSLFRLLTEGEGRPAGQTHQN